MRSLFFLTMTVAFPLLLLIGCTETNDSTDSVVTINLYSWPDTIECLLWDEMPYFPDEVCIIAEVLRDGTPVAGVPVAIDLHAAHAWEIEYRDSVLQCTTYVNGRVEFIYYTGCHGGCDTIIVSALGESAAALVHFDTDTMYVLSMDVGEDTLHVPAGSEDSVEVIIWLKTSRGVGIADSIITLMASGGRLDYLPPTGEWGRTSTWWHTNHEYGRFTLVASVSHIADTARIVVDSLCR